ncbi:hypothetical protein ABZ234_08230 [Nocardiopsis sp. NPDC006198]|uniref:hypothetical protein n=1 Tax=Nocardiopsis sp. NPDC006198 TaxID=3154472 RepID=UPI0033ADEBD0
MDKPAETAAPALATLTYGPHTTRAIADRLTPQTIQWFSESSCPLMAWALVHQASLRGRTLRPAIVGDASAWGDWWHMGALTEDEQLFVDASGAHDVDVVCAWWRDNHKIRRHRQNDTAVSIVTDLFYTFLDHDPRDVAPSTRRTTLALADQVLATNGLCL